MFFCQPLVKVIIQAHQIGQKYYFFFNDFKSWQFYQIHRIRENLVNLEICKDFSIIDPLNELLP